MVLSLAIAFMLPACLTATVLWHRHFNRLYVVVLGVEHAAFALELGAVVALVGARAGATLLTLAMALVLADALLFVHSGLRIQLALLRMMSALPAMAARMPWRRAVAGLVAGTVLLWTATARVLAVRHSASARDGMLAAATGFVLMGVAHALRRRLPLHLTYAWNLRCIALQGRALSAAVAWLLRGGIAVGEASKGLPPALVPQRELGAPVDARYPLLRQSRGFVGDKHFSLRLDDGEKPHVVCLFLESFRAADVGALGGNPGRATLTPNFDALAQRGVLWNDFYANGTITSLALTSALYGIPPALAQRSREEGAVAAPVIGAPHVFAERGYLPAFFCDGPLDWEGKRQFLMHNGFPLFYGAPSIKAAFPEAPDSVWHFRDEYLMRFHADWLATHDARNRATFSAMLTVSNHFPWQAPPDAPVPDVAIDPKSVFYRYLQTTMYTDKCLGLYMDLLRERSLYDKTVFFILGDHAQQVNDENDVSWSGRYTSEGVRVPCLLLAPGRLDPAVISETASQVDLLPTLMDMFDIRTTHHAVGTSMARRCATRQAVSVHPWEPGMVATRFDSFRHVYSLEAHRSALYDVQRDPGEHQDIAEAHPYLVNDCESAVEHLRDTLATLYEEHRLAPPQSTAYLSAQRFLRAAPEGFPDTLGACRTRLQTLNSLGAKRGKIHASETCILLLALETLHLSDDERLDFAQLLLARLHIQGLGELTDAEEARLAALETKAAAKLDAPRWERSLADSVRPMAHNKPFQFFRTAR